jgi:hypothetical protein
MLHANETPARRLWKQALRRYPKFRAKIGAEVSESRWLMWVCRCLEKHSEEVVLNKLIGQIHASQLRLEARRAKRVRAALTNRRIEDEEG